MGQSVESGLFGAQAPVLPEGFRYRSDLVSTDEEGKLVAQIQTLPFKDFEFHGFVGKRRIVSFGWQYHFDNRTLQKANDIPEFLLPLREKAAEFAHLKPADLPHV